MAWPTAAGLPHRGPGPLSIPQLIVLGPSAYVIPDLSAPPAIKIFALAPNLGGIPGATAGCFRSAGRPCPPLKRVRRAFPLFPPGGDLSGRRARGEPATARFTPPRWPGYRRQTRGARALPGQTPGRQFLGPLVVSPCRQKFPNSSGSQPPTKGKLEVLGIGIEDKAESVQNSPRPTTWIPGASSPGTRYPLAYAGPSATPRPACPRIIDRNGQMVSKRLGVMKKADLDAGCQVSSKNSAAPHFSSSPSPPGSLRAEAAVTVFAAGDIAPVRQRGAPRAVRLLARHTGPILAPRRHRLSPRQQRKFRRCFDPVWGSLARIVPVPGNHEYRHPGAAGYFDYFGAAASQLRRQLVQPHHRRMADHRPQQQPRRRRRGGPTALARRRTRIQTASPAPWPSSTIPAFLPASTATRVHGRRLAPPRQPPRDARPGRPRPPLRTLCPPRRRRPAQPGRYPQFVVGTGGRPASTLSGRPRPRPNSRAMELGRSQARTRPPPTAGNSAQRNRCPGRPGRGTCRH